MSVEKTIFQRIVEARMRLKRANEENHYTASGMKAVHNDLIALKEDFIYLNEKEEVMFIECQEEMRKFLSRKVD